MFAWTRARNFSFPGWRLVVTPLPHRTSFLRVRSMLAYSRASSSLPLPLLLLTAVSGVAAAAGGLCDDGDALTSSGAVIASGGEDSVVSIFTGTFLPGGAGGDSWTAGGRRGIGDGMSRDGGASGTSPLVLFGGIIACDI